MSIPKNFLDRTLNNLRMFRNIIQLYHTKKKRAMWKTCLNLIVAHLINLNKTNSRPNRVRKKQRTVLCFLLCGGGEIRTHMSKRTPVFKTGGIAVIRPLQKMRRRWESNPQAAFYTATV